MKTTDINTLTPDQLMKRVQELEVKLNSMTQGEPMLVRIGSCKNESDIVSFLCQIRITPDHLLTISQMLLHHLWESADAGEEKANIIKDVQYDIHDLYELAAIAQYLRTEKE